MSRAVKKEKLCFSITGEFVTKTARSWLYEENRLYTDVLKFLLACMVGTKIKKEKLKKYANDVLSGKKKFIGNTKDDSYCMVDDDTDVLTVYSLYFENLKIKEPVIEDVDDSRREDFEDKIESCFDEINDNLKSLNRRRVNKHDDYGWLSPQGKFTPVEWGSHESWAREYCGKHFKDVDSDRPFFYPGDFLEKNGWILLHNPHLGAVEIPDWQLKKATKRQKEFLYDYFQERKMFSEVRAVWKD